MQTGSSLAALLVALLALVRDDVKKKKINRMKHVCKLENIVFEIHLFREKKMLEKS